VRSLDRQRNHQHRNQEDPDQGECVWEVEREQDAGLSYPAPPSGPQRTVLEVMQTTHALGAVGREVLRARLEFDTQFIE
jgi:hypothetical protein